MLKPLLPPELRGTRSTLPPALSCENSISRLPSLLILAALRLLQIRLPSTKRCELGSLPCHQQGSLRSIQSEQSLLPCMPRSPQHAERSSEMQSDPRPTYVGSLLRYPTSDFEYVVKLQALASAKQGLGPEGEPGYRMFHGRASCRVPFDGVSLLSLGAVRSATFGIMLVPFTPIQSPRRSRHHTLSLVGSTVP